VGKPMASICLLRLAERGRLDLDAPVARHWPEFAAAGKEAVTPRTVLSHRAGLPAIRRELPEGAMYDWGLMADALAAQEPWWEPGSAHGYPGAGDGRGVRGARPRARPPLALRTRLPAHPAGAPARTGPAQLRPLRRRRLPRL